MNLLVTLIIGGLVGWLAARVLGRREGIIASVVIGIVGSFIGGVLSSSLSGSGQSYFQLPWSGLVWSFIGALILVVILNAFQHKSHHNVS